MSGHGLEEGSREGKVAVLDEDGEVSESERLRLKAILYIMTIVNLETFFYEYGELLYHMFGIES